MSEDLASEHGFHDSYQQHIKFKSSLMLDISSKVPRMIVCAAVKDNHGKICLGIRHFDQLMGEQIDLMKEDEEITKTYEQGFIDNRGNFLTRGEALKVAMAAGQIRRRVPGDTTQLFSENLY